MKVFRNLVATVTLATCVLTAGGVGAAHAADAQTPDAPATEHVGGADVPLTKPAPVARTGPSTQAVLPASVNLMQWAVPVGDQGQIQSCVAWAIDYAMLGWYSNKEGHAGTPFAPMYTYSQLARGQNVGTRPSDAFYIAKNQGNDTAAHYWQGWSDYTTQPDASEVANAAYHRIKSYTAISPYSTPIKEQLSYGRPVAISMVLRNTFQSVRGWGAYNDTTSSYTGGHEILALGYDQYGLIIQNSWGKGWGAEGFGRLSWNVVDKDVTTAYVIGGFASTTTTNPGTDTIKPTVTKAKATIQSGGQIGTAGSVPVSLSWSGNDASGIARYDLWLSLNGGAWEQKGITTQLSAAYRFARGTKVSTAVRAQDKAGNWSDYAIDSLTVGSGNETTTGISYSSGWSRLASTSFYGGYAYGSRTPGAVVKVKFTGRAVALMTTRAANRGQLKVWIDGTYKGVIDTRSTTTSYRMVTYPVSASGGTHSITFQVVGTAGRPQVDVDGIAILG